MLLNKLSLVGFVDLLSKGLLPFEENQLSGFFSVIFSNIALKFAVEVGDKLLINFDFGYHRYSFALIQKSVFWTFKLKILP